MLHFDVVITAFLHLPSLQRALSFYEFISLQRAGMRSKDVVLGFVFYAFDSAT